jgi:hypothetical protein
VRQRTAVIMGVLWLAFTALMVAIVVTGGGADLWVVGALLLVGSLGYVLLLRPSLTLAHEGLVIVNPFRQVRVPWHLVEDLRTYWSLQVGTPAGRQTVWALSSSRHQTRAGMRRNLYADPQDVESVAKLIGTVQDGLNLADATGEVAVAWSPLSVGLVGIPALVLLAGLLS